MWMEKLPWRYPATHTATTPVVVAFGPDTTDVWIDVYLLWTATEDGETWSLYQQHRTYDVANSIWSYLGVPDPVTTLNLRDVPANYGIKSVERSVTSGDFLIELANAGGTST